LREPAAPSPVRGTSDYMIVNIDGPVLPARSP